MPERRNGRMNISTRASWRNEESREGTHFMTSAKPIASSIPGIANARSCMIPFIPPASSPAQYQILATDISGVVERQRLENESGEGERILSRTGFNHILHRSTRVNLHCRQVREPIHFRCLLSKLLRERIRQVVCRIGRTVSIPNPNFPS